MSDFSSHFPAVLEIDYPQRERDALTTFFRPLTVIPIAVVLSLLSGPAVYASAEHAIAAGSGIVWLPTMLTLVFRQKYPRWWFDWNLELTRFSTESRPTSRSCGTSIPPPTRSRQSTWISRTRTRGSSIAGYHW